MKSWVRNTVWFAGTFIATTLFVNSSLVEPIGLRLEDALQRAWPVGQARYCKVVSITAGDYKKRFAGTSPLDPVELKSVISRLLEFQPAVLAIDIDTSAPRFATVSRDLRLGSTRIVWARPDPGGIPGPIWGHPEEDPRYSGVGYYLRDLDGKHRLFERTVPNGSRSLDTLHWAVVKAYCESDREGAPGGEEAPAVCSSRVIQERTEVPPARPRFREYDELPHQLKDVLGTLAPGTGNMLQGQVVILGGEYDERDRLETPIGQQFGDLIIGELVEAELRGDIIRDLPRWAGYVIELAIGLLVLRLYGLYSRRPNRAVLSVGIFGVVAAASAIGAYYLGKFWLDAGVFLLAIAIEHHVEAVRNASELEHGESDKASA
jgi:CHASE2 domain